MKTTVEISSALLAEVRRLASKQGTTLRALIEEGLRRLVDERATRRPFTLRDASFHGNGLQAEVREGSWERVRDLIYQGRGA